MFRKKTVDIPEDVEVIRSIDFPLIEIQNKKETIFKIENNGDVFWLKNGTLQKAEIDTDLSMAFTFCVLELTGFTFNDVIDRLIKERIERKKC
jgi:hypothetical protein